MRESHLFDEGELIEVLRQREAKMYQEIEGYERNYILNASMDDLCNYLEQGRSAHRAARRVRW